MSAFTSFSEEVRRWCSSHGCVPSLVKTLGHSSLWERRGVELFLALLMALALVLTIQSGWHEGFEGYNQLWTQCIFVVNSQWLLIVSSCLPSGLPSGAYRLIFASDTIKTYNQWFWYNFWGLLHWRHILESYSFCVAVLKLFLLQKTWACVHIMIH